MKSKFDVTKHCLVPQHEKLIDKDKKELLEKYRISIKELPRILAKDAAIAHMKVKEGDIIKITRPSCTAGKTVFYRCVINA